MKQNLILIIVLFLVRGLTAQEWMKNVKSNNPTFFEIQLAFNNYWKDKDVKKGKGYKAFKRWEWQWKQRVGKNGEFPPMDILMTEYLKYNKNQSIQKSIKHTNTTNWIFEGLSSVSNPGTGSGIGRVSCMAFHPTNANIFWVGTPAGGLWKTINGGQTWATTTDNLPVLGVTDIVIDPTNPNTMYIATGDGDARDTKSVGILKSIDGGATWNLTGMNWSITLQKTIGSLIINPSNTQILIAATSDGIWRTIDGGINWTQYESGKWFIDLKFKPNDPNYVYASMYDVFGNAQIYTSIDGGTSWAQASNFSGVTRIGLSVSSNSVNLVDAVCVDSQDGLFGFATSLNSGNSFSIYYTGTCNNNLLDFSTDASACGGQGWYDLAYTINPNNVNERWVGGINTWKSTDDGLTWNLNNYFYQQNNPTVPTTHADKHFLIFHPLQPNTLFECNDGGIYKTLDGGQSWIDLSDGLGISQIYRLGTSATVNNNVVFGMQDDGTKGLEGGVFYDLTDGDGMEAIIDYANSNIQYSSLYNGKIYKTTDDWLSVNTIVQTNGLGVNEKGAWVTPYIMHPTNPNTLLVGKSQVYESNDGGSNWHSLASIPGLLDNIDQIAYAPSDPNTIYVTSGMQRFKTINGGATWITLISATDNITYIAVNPTNSLEVYMTTSGYTSGNKVFKSIDGGANWINISGTLPNVPANCIVYQNNTNDVLYVGTDLGVFYKDATMIDWIPYNTGLPNVIINELEISYIDNKIWAATFGRGLWSSALAIPTNTKPLNDLHLSSSIIIQPNPSSGVFLLTTMSDFYNKSLNVFNMLGELVYETKTTGAKTTLDLSIQPNGFYYVKLEDGNKTISKKIVITK